MTLTQKSNLSKTSQVKQSYTKFKSEQQNTKQKDVVRRLEVNSSGKARNKNLSFATSKQSPRRERMLSEDDKIKSTQKKLNPKEYLNLYNRLIQYEYKKQIAIKKLQEAKIKDEENEY